jgi:transposase
MHERGLNKHKVAELLGISRTTVIDDIRRYEETESNEDRPGRGRKKTARSKRNIQRVKGMIQRNRTTKIRSKKYIKIDGFMGGRFISGHPVLLGVQIFHTSNSVVQ